MHKQPDHLSVSGLMDRGWTNAMIKTLLGAPDRTATNPKYKNASPMRLYAKTRVDEIERSEAFREAAKVADRRKVAARAAAETRRRALLDEVELLEVKVAHIPDEELLRRSIDHYNARGPRRRHGEFDDRWCPADASSDSAFLQRIQVNYARHVLTKYDNTLEQLARRTGVTDAITAVRRKVYNAIGLTWPDLARECERQLSDRITVL